ncbi:hypothetical protein [Actinomadura barringtoniae]|nr:hypothetical protein [Actinomadura barringtoniae]
MSPAAATAAPPNGPDQHWAGSEIAKHETDPPGEAPPYHFAVPSSSSGAA